MGRSRKELRQAGLARLAMEVMEVRVDKAEWISRSRWDNSCLTYDQIGYACVDAFLSFEISRRLLSWPVSSDELKQGSRVSLPVHSSDELKQMGKMHSPLPRKEIYEFSEIVDKMLSPLPRKISDDECSEMVDKMHFPSPRKISDERLEMVDKMHSPLPREISDECLEMVDKMHPPLPCKISDECLEMADKMHSPLPRKISDRCLKMVCWFVLWLVVCDAGLVSLFVAWFIDLLVYLISCWLDCLRLIGVMTCWLSSLVVGLVTQ